jgi:nucleotide-binding universal stress UspA family protein
MPVKHIVVGYDSSDTAGLAVVEAANLARATGAELHIVNVVEDFDFPQSTIAGDEDQTHKETAITVNEKLLATPEAEGGLLEAIDGVFTHNKVMAGPPAGSIIDYATEIGADLVVVGNRRVQGFNRLLGSVAVEILRHAPCSVYVAHTV